MSITKLANLALALVPIGWLLALYGVMSQLGDPASTAARYAIESQRHVSNTILLVGVMCLIASLWLSGSTFAAARKRSLLATASIAIPTVLIIADFY
jgi:hypothetical protein